MCFRLDSTIAGEEIVLLTNTTIVITNEEFSLFFPFVSILHPMYSL